MTAGLDSHIQLGEAHNMDGGNLYEDLFKHNETLGRNDSDVLQDFAMLSENLSAILQQKVREKLSV